MKKILLFTVFLLGSVVITNAQIKFKVDANLSFSNLDINVLGANPKKIPGYRVNGAVEMPFAGKESTGLYYFSPGLSVLSKGAKIKEQGITMDLEEGVMELTMRPHYLQIPLQLGARFRFPNNLGFSLQFGPYLSYGFASKAKLIETELYSKEKKIIEFDLFEGKKLEDKEIKPAFTRFDFGGTVQVSFEFSHFYTQAGTDFGIADIAKSIDIDNVRIKNSDFFLGLGVRF